MRTHMIILMILLTTQSTGSADTELTWTRYYHMHPNTIRDIAVGENYVWCGCVWGCLRWKKDGSSFNYFDYYSDYKASKALDVEIDKENRPWFGSNNGVRVYDNDIWTAYTTDDGLHDRWITTVAIENDGTKWFGAGNRVTRFDGKDWTIYEVPGNITDIESDERGGMWFATINGVYVLNGETWKQYTVENGLTHNNVSDIEFDRNGTAWFATGGGVCGFDGSTWTTISLVPSSIVTIDNAGNKWCVGSEGVVNFDGEIWHRHHEMDGLRVYDIEAEANGIVWCGTDDGLFHFDGEQWIQYKADTGSPYIIASGITVDTHDNIWVSSTGPGTSDAFPPYIPSGVFMFDGETWTQHTTDDGLVSNEIWCIASSQTGTVWCGSPDGISKFDGSSWRSWTRINGRELHSINAITCDTAGNAWISSSYSIYKYIALDGTFTDMTDITGGFKYFYSLKVDEDGVVWIGSDKGLRRIEGDKVVWLLENVSVTSIAFDADGKVWAGIATGGIMVYDGENWTLIALDEKDPTRSAHEIAIDHNGVKWFASGMGLYSYDDISWSYYDNTNSPLSPQSINKLVIDSRNRKWALTRYELFCIEDGITSVNESRPHSRFLEITGNYPNPFNSLTTIEFILPTRKVVNLSVYSITGQKIRTLPSENFSPGRHTVLWDGKDYNGVTVSSGIYFSHLKAGTQSASHRMIFLK